jgi:hypothetical protein
MGCDLFLKCIIFYIIEFQDMIVVIISFFPKSNGIYRDIN